MTRDQSLYRLAYWIACIILAATFLSAGYHKVMNPPAFAVAVYNYQLLPDHLVNMASLFFQWLEIVCGICLLLIPRLRTAALWIILFLLILFSGAIGINLVRGAVIDCGCFSAASDAAPLNGMSIWRNLVLAILVGMAFYGRKSAAV